MKVRSTGDGIRVPVGPAVLGRVMDVLGRPIDERGPVEAKELRVIHQAAPKFDELSPSLERLIGPVKILIDAYLEGRIDEVHLFGNRFVNTMKQDPLHSTIIPIPQTWTTAEGQEVVDAAGPSGAHAWDYLYEPDAKTVLDELLVRYIETFVYQAAVDNIACEQSARMVAMKAASDNAQTIIEELQLIYNKNRQAAITKEISEIVSGAAAV